MESEKSTLQRVLEKLQDIQVAIVKLTVEMSNNHRAFREFEARTDIRNNNIETALFGNKNPEDALVYKTQRNTEFRVFWEKFGWLILAGFAGVPCTIVAGIVLHVVGAKQ